MSGSGTSQGVLAGAHGNGLRWEAFDGAQELSVLFAHGGGQTRRAWRRAALCLQQLGYPSLTYDKRGHGDSDWSEAGDYRLHDFQADLDRVIDHWNRPCVLVGASLGGLTSLMSAAQGHRTVRGLVLIDTAPQLNPAEITRLIDFLTGGSDAGFATPAAAAAHVRQFFPQREVTPEGIEASLEPTPDGRWRWRWDVRVVIGERNSIALPHEAELHACARAVRVPFLLLRARLSELVSEAAVERLRACAPQLEVAWLEGADHIVGGADGPRVVEAILPFLDQCARGVTP